MAVTIADPISLPCGVRLKNRLAKAAMTEGLGDETNRATRRLETLYRRWAAGGAGLLLTGNVQIDRRYLERPGNVAIDGPQDADAMRALEGFAGAARGTGAEIIVQLSHAGRQTPIYVNKTPAAPSAAGLELPGGQFGAPRALAAAEIEDVIDRFAHAASVCKAAGFSGVQIHGAHGYLISEFLNPNANRREDEWGGSLDNRARLLLRTVAAVRAKVGSGFPVAVKLNSADFQKGGFSFDECLRVIDWLNEEGVDFLEISGGSYEQPKMMDIEGASPAEEPRASTKAREAYFIQYAEEAARVAKMPLMVTGGFRSRAAMDAALTSGAADLIGLARPMCVDPDICAKLLSGASAEAIRYEKNLRLGGGFWGPNSGNTLIKALNGFAAMSFFYENIFRLADGKEASAEIPLLPTFIAHQMHERRAAKRLKRFAP
ncbi:MAG: NADH:flavin oxidoreductase [Alphaproteobacteria bacterium RIFCSPHIGHO2_12_FULL_63_12]|nr:MAG: NADH:flavin oxidoreductase [Alphaproteobacteria bacterium RIFCSPHIGHO2_12_FULL_63_12]